MKLLVKPSKNVALLYKTHKAAFFGDSGIDLFFPLDVVVPPRTSTMIDLEVCCEMVSEDNRNVSYYVYPRSSISKTPLIMHNSVGIIDAGYRHSIKVVVYNTSDNEYTIKSGERLFQVCANNLQEITLQVVDELSETNRGAGFGSSGK
jgi:dUTP pyrophosphatase